MASTYDQKIRRGADQFLEDGEQVLATLVVRPRGWTQAGSGAAGPGSIASSIGARKQARNYEAADRSGFRITSPMALVVTDRRLLSLKIGSPIGLGIGGAVKELVDAAPLTDVDGIEVKRLAVGKTLTVTVRGTPFVLETGAGGDAKGAAAAVERAKATHPPV